MDYMTNRVNLCIYTCTHIISFVYLWIKNRMLKHLFYHFQSPWGIVTFGTFIFPVKRWFLNCLKQVEEIFSRRFTLWQLYIGEGKGEHVWTCTESQKLITFLSSAQSDIQAEKISFHGGANNNIQISKGPQASCHQLWFSTWIRCEYLQIWAAFLLLWRLCLRFFPQNFPHKKVNSSKINFGGP